MAKFKFEGLDDYIQKINRLADPKRAEGLIKAAVYPGAGVIADAVRERLSTHSRTGDLADSMFLSVMENENGYVYTQLGFAGYDGNGVPNAVKAAVLESGSSRQKKTPFIRPAVKSAKDKAEAAMAAELESRIKQLMED